jgi:hypothetical protein
MGVRVRFSRPAHLRREVERGSEAHVLQQFDYRYDLPGNRTAEQMGGVLTGTTYDRVTASSANRLAAYCTSVVI